MPWKDLGSKDRSLLVAAWIQATATVGMFAVALVGIWRVAPIITYTIQQQAQQVEQAKSGRASARPETETLAGRFVADAHAWWHAQVASYRRIIEITSASGPGGLRVSYQLISGGGAEVAAGLRPDLLVVTAISVGGEKVTVSVPVNENAMSPSQYLQCKVNQGYFAELDPVLRQRVDIAVARYLREYMLPKAPPAFVQPGMTLRQLHDEVQLHQIERERALEHIQALRSVLDEAMSPS